MKRILFFVFATIFVSINYANNIVDNVVELPKNFKVENTFSGDLTDTKSFHLIFSKNKENKKYTVHSYLYNGKNVEEIQIIENEKPFQVVSFHHENDILSVLLSFKGKDKKEYLNRVDYNLTHKKAFKSKVFKHEDFLTSVRLKNKSILIYKNKNFFTVKQFKANKPILEKQYTLKKENSKVKDFFKDKTVTTIKTDEFVANGSTNKVKLYYFDDTLFFTKDSDEPLEVNVAGISLNKKKANITQLLKFSLKEDNLKPIFLRFVNAEGKKFKKATSYLLDNKLFQLALSKKKGFIKISDITNGKSLNEIALNSSLSKYIKGNPKFLGFERFLKEAGKNKHDATITVNSTKNTDKLIVRVDYVDINYSYNYNWWWHHHQFMMWQNQMNMHHNFSVPSGFGPSQPNDFLFETVTIGRDKRFFELLIDKNGLLSDEKLPQTTYTEINKREKIKELEKIKGIKHQSSCFLKNVFRYIAYSKKLKSFIFQTNKVK